ncbi:bonus [Anaeramoeba flamelloides]|uniref:Bonus n=1 Tax=Anaeramoeba flamelloides TaxID=1746091 RepID=A0ABQ8ZDQ9_9EUKA|nr:bonus [Anaeramoeba flamelloides]
MSTSFPVQPEKEKEEETIWCDNCLQEEDRKVQAIVYCHDCGKNLCEECDLIHKVSGFKKHLRTDPKLKEKIVDPNSDDSEDNLTENCLIHQNNKLSRYCNNCQKLICSECSFDHSNHETISFDQSMDFYQELMKEQKKMHSKSF